MSIRGWLAERSPTGVLPLDPWVAGEPGGPGLVRTDQRVSWLTERAVVGVTATREAPGRVRESAFHLLAADALLTYACEAALECDDVEGALSAVAGSVLQGG